MEGFTETMPRRAYSRSRRSRRSRSVPRRTSSRSRARSSSRRRSPWHKLHKASRRGSTNRRSQPKTLRYTHRDISSLVKRALSDLPPVRVDKLDQSDDEDYDESQHVFVGSVTEVPTFSMWTEFLGLQSLLGSRASAWSRTGYLYNGWSRTDRYNRRGGRGRSAYTRGLVPMNNMLELGEYEYQDWEDFVDDAVDYYTQNFVRAIEAAKKTKAGTWEDEPVLSTNGMFSIKIKHNGTDEYVVSGFDMPSALFRYYNFMQVQLDKKANTP